MSFLGQSAANSCRLSKMVSKSKMLSSIFFSSPKFFSTETEEPSKNEPPPSGLVYGRITNVTKYTLKSDIIHLLDDSNLSPDKLKFEYNRSYIPFAIVVEFSSESDYDSAFKAIGRKGRLFGLARADRGQWDAIAPYDGKAISLQGVPVSASIDEIERFLSGSQNHLTSISMPPRPASRGSVKTVVVRFPSQALAMHAYITKNRGFCLNSQVSVKILH